MGQHTVEKIGGTSMTRFGELMENILIGSRRGAELYNRIFVVSAYGGITNLLLENKKTAEPICKPIPCLPTNMPSPPQKRMHLLPPPFSIQPIRCRHILSNMPSLPSNRWNVFL